MRVSLQITYRWARRIAVGLIGGTVLLAGLAMIVLPGPGLIVIPIGLGILGVEFAWARRWLEKLRSRSDQVIHGMRRNARQVTQRAPREAP